MGFVNGVKWVLVFFGCFSIVLASLGLMIAFTLSSIEETIQGPPPIQERMINRLVNEHYEEVSSEIRDEFTTKPTKEELKNHLLLQFTGKSDFVPRKLIISMTGVSIILFIVGVLFIFIGKGLRSGLRPLGIGLSIGSIIGAILFWILRKVLPLMFDQYLRGGKTPEMFNGILRDLFQEVIVSPLNQGIVLSVVVLIVAIIIMIVGGKERAMRQ